MTGSVNLYDNIYADFGSDAERAVRVETYGEDLGQSSWLLFTDAMVVTGVVSHEELATRSSIGFYLFVASGANEAMLREAGFMPFDGLQRFLGCVRTLSEERRLSRFAYLVEKPARGGEDG